MKTITIFPVTEADYKNHHGYDSHGFDWGEIRFVTDDEEESCGAEPVEFDGNLGGLANNCGLDGSLTEPMLIVAAINKYDACVGYLKMKGIVTAEEVAADDDWTSYTPESLDCSEPEYYADLCDAVERTFGKAAGDAQRLALADVLETEPTE